MACVLSFSHNSQWTDVLVLIDVLLNDLQLYIYHLSPNTDATVRVYVCVCDWWFRCSLLAWTTSSVNTSKWLCWTKPNTNNRPLCLRWTFDSEGRTSRKLKLIPYPKIVSAVWFWFPRLKKENEQTTNYIVFFCSDVPSVPLLFSQSVKDLVHLW